MFSAFKKLANKNEVTVGAVNGNGLSGGKAGEGQGIHSMSHNLQKKFSKVSR